MSDKERKIALIFRRKINVTIVMYTAPDNPDIWKIAYNESSKLVDMYLIANIALANAPQNTDTLTNIEKLRWAKRCRFVVYSSEQMQNQVSTRSLVSNGFIFLMINPNLKIFYLFISHLFF